MNINKVFLHDLLAAKSPSGYERNATKVFNDYMYVVDGAKFEFEDNANNVAWSVGAENPLKVIMLSGHIDRYTNNLLTGVHPSSDIPAYMIQHIEIQITYISIYFSLKANFINLKYKGILLP